VGGKNRLQLGIICVALVAAIAIVYFNVFVPNRSPDPPLEISQVIADAKRGIVKRIQVQGNTGDLLVTFRDEPHGTYWAHMDRDESITRLLLAAGVPLDSVQIIDRPSDTIGDMITIGSGLLAFFFVGALFLVLVRQARSGNKSPTLLAQKGNRAINRNDLEQARMSR
jgi:cell division protease FtsH